TVIFDFSPQNSSCVIGMKRERILQKSVRFELEACRSLMLGMNRDSRVIISYSHYSLYLFLFISLSSICISSIFLFFFP
ncbi:hypothetical protein L9F63_007054, partial [Diploptera punctata]